MKVVIQVAAEDDAKAWALMMRHSPGIALPNRVFVISEEAVRSLQEAGIRFTELAHPTPAAGAQGVVPSERV